jgi:hypothetical protein
MPERTVGLRIRRKGIASGTVIRDGLAVAMQARPKGIALSATSHSIVRKKLLCLTRDEIETRKPCVSADIDAVYKQQVHCFFTMTSSG